MAYGNKACDVAEELEVGDVGFVVEHENHRTHQRWKTISVTPAETNMSHGILLNGWVGTMNDVRAEAAGVARVVDVGYDCGERFVRVVPVPPTKLGAALERLGHGELA